MFEWIALLGPPELPFLVGLQCSSGFYPSLYVCLRQSEMMKGMGMEAMMMDMTKANTATS